VHFSSLYCWQRSIEHSNISLKQPFYPLLIVTTTACKVIIKKPINPNTFKSLEISNYIGIPIQCKNDGGLGHIFQILILILQRHLKSFKTEQQTKKKA